MPFIIALIVIIVAMALMFLFMPKPKGPSGIKPEELDIPRTDEGIEFAKIFGTVEISEPTVAWHNHRAVVPIRQKGGKK